MTVRDGRVGATGRIFRKLVNGVLRICKTCCGSCKPGPGNGPFSCCGGFAPAQICVNISAPGCPALNGLSTMVFPPPGTDVSSSTLWQWIQPPIGGTYPFNECINCAGGPVTGPPNCPVSETPCTACLPGTQNLTGGPPSAGPWWNWFCCNTFPRRAAFDAVGWISCGTYANTTTGLCPVSTEGFDCLTGCCVNIGSGNITALESGIYVSCTGSNNWNLQSTAGYQMNSSPDSVTCGPPFSVVWSGCAICTPGGSPTPITITYSTCTSGNFPVYVPTLCCPANSVATLLTAHWTQLSGTGCALDGFGCQMTYQPDTPGGSVLTWTFSCTFTTGCTIAGRLACQYPGASWTIDSIVMTCAGGSCPGSIVVDTLTVDCSTATFSVQVSFAPGCPKCPSTTFQLTITPT